MYPTRLRSEARINKEFRRLWVTWPISCGVNFQVPDQMTSGFAKSWKGVTCGKVLDEIVQIAGDRGNRQWVTVVIQSFIDQGQFEIFLLRHFDQLLQAAVEHIRTLPTDNKPLDPGRFRPLDLLQHDCPVVTTITAQQWIVDLGVVPMNWRQTRCNSRPGWESGLIGWKHLLVWLAQLVVACTGAAVPSKSALNSTAISHWNKVLFLESPERSCR